MVEQTGLLSEAGLHSASRPGCHEGLPRPGLGRGDRGLGDQLPDLLVHPVGRTEGGGGGGLGLGLGLPGLPEAGGETLAAPSFFFFPLMRVPGRVGRDVWSRLSLSRGRRLSRAVCFKVILWKLKVNSHNVQLFVYLTLNIPVDTI